MGFWIMIGWWLATQIAAALLFKPKVEDARPSGLDEFQVPTATEGREIPVIVGKVKISSPNVVWYGDLKTVAIREKVGDFFGIGGKKVTKAYQYYLGVQCAICSGPIDGIDRIWFGDKVILSGESAGNRSIDDAGFFGGEDKGGGIKFTLEAYMGAQTTANAYLAQFQTPTPAYFRTCYVVMTDGAGGPGYIGNSANLRNLAFEPFWYPNSLAVTGGKHRIGDDANPICFLYELLVTNDDWGVQFQGGDVLVTGTVAQGALRAVAEQVADEGLGFSMVIDRGREIRDIIQEIERHVDGAFRLDLTDGRYKIILARAEATTPPLLDESNIETFETFTRGNWNETKNEVRIGYADRGKEYNSTFQPDYDNANRQIVGRRTIATLQFPGVKEASVANKIAAREIVSLAHPVAKATLFVNRTQYARQRGDRVRITWPDEGLTNFPARIIRAAYGDDRRGRIRLDLIEDVFRLEDVGFADNPVTQWTPPITTPVAALDARIWEPPLQLAPSTYQPILLVARNGGLQLTFDVYTDTNGGTDAFVLTNTELDSWTPIGSLQGAVAKDLDGPPHYSGSIIVDGLSDITIGDLIAAASATVSSQDPSNILLVDDELMFWTAAVDNMDGSATLTVQRGAFGTIPADHSDNARVWFPVFGAVTVFENSALWTYGPIRCRVVTKTATGELAIGSAPNIPLSADYAIQGVRPYAPGDPQVNGLRFVDGDWTKTPGVLRVTFNPRNRFSQPFGTKQDDTGISVQGTFYAVTIRRVDTAAIVKQAGSVPGGVYNAEGFIPQTTPGVPDELDYNVTIVGLSGGASSQVWLTQNFEVFGFGIDFGGDFGGQDTGGPNLGVVLNQGAAPAIVEPLPGTGNERQWELQLLGSIAAADDLILRFQFFDELAQDTFVIQNSPNYSGYTSLTALAEKIEDDLLAGLSGRPFSVARNGTTIQIQSSFGSVSFSSNTGSGSNWIYWANWRAQAAAAASAPVKGIYSVDWYEVVAQAGDNVEVLSPTSDPVFLDPSQAYQSRIDIYGLTYSRKLEIEDEAQTSINFFWQDENDFSSLYSDSMKNWLPDASAGTIRGLVHELANLGGNISSFFESVSFQQVDIYTFPMQRAAAVIWCKENVGVVPQFYETHGYSYPGGYKMLIKEVRKPVAGSTSGLSEIRVVNFSHLGAAKTNRSYRITLDGTTYTQAIATPYGPTEQAAALASLVATIDALGTFDATIESGTTLSRVTITRTATNVAFEMFAQESINFRAEWRQTI